MRSKLQTATRQGREVKRQPMQTMQAVPLKEEMHTEPQSRQTVRSIYQTMPSKGTEQSSSIIGTG
jgi:hypothetical protein